LYYYRKILKFLKKIHPQCQFTKLKWFLKYYFKLSKLYNVNTTFLLYLKKYLLLYFKRYKKLLIVIFNKAQSKNSLNYIRYKKLLHFYIKKKKYQNISSFLRFKNFQLQYLQLLNYKIYLEFFLSKIFNLTFIFNFRNFDSIFLYRRVPSFFLKQYYSYKFFQKQIKRNFYILPLYHIIILASYTKNLNLFNYYISFLMQRTRNHLSFFTYFLQLLENFFLIFANLYGIKLWVNGKFNGSTRAFFRYYNIGIPMKLQQIHYSILYKKFYSNTYTGSFGIHLWLYYLDNK